MHAPDRSLESLYTGPVAGVDEAGRGPWAGPVIASAVILGSNCNVTGINDSKKLSAARREYLYEQIMAQCTVGVGSASVEEIDSMNILAATKLAMRRAVEALAIVPCIALIDGNQAPDLACPARTVVSGDANCLSIAAACIVAKVTRDRIMEELSLKFPGYGWDKNAGYGTAQHQKALAELGITPHHRRSFAPVRSLLESTKQFAA